MDQWAGVFDEALSEEVRAFLEHLDEIELKERPDATLSDLAGPTELKIAIDWENIHQIIDEGTRAMLMKILGPRPDGQPSEHVPEPTPSTVAATPAVEASQGNAGGATTDNPEAGLNEEHTEEAHTEEALPENPGSPSDRQVEALLTAFLEASGYEQPN